MTPHKPPTREMPLHSRTPRAPCMGARSRPPGGRVRPFEARHPPRAGERIRTADLPFTSWQRRRACAPGPLLEGYRTLLWRPPGSRLLAALLAARVRAGDPRIKKTGSALVGAVQVRPVLRSDQALTDELAGHRPAPSIGVAAPVAARPASSVRFSGRTYPQLARIVRALCAVAGR